MLWERTNSLWEIPSWVVDTSMFKMVLIGSEFIFCSVNEVMIIHHDVMARRKKKASICKQWVL